MKRNALIPFALIMVFGIGLIFALSLIGMTSNEASGGNGKTPVAMTPQEIYSQKCFQCHGDNFEGLSGPSLLGVGERLSAEEIREVVKNGKSLMPGGLVPDGNLDQMVEWLMTLK